LFNRPFPEGSTAVTPDRQALAICHDDGSIRLWSTTMGKVLGVFPALPQHSAEYLAFAPNGRMLAAFYSQYLRDNQLVLWHVATRTEKARFNLSSGQANSLHFSPDSQLLAAGMSDHVIPLWEASTGREWATLAGHQGDVGSAPFSPDGRTLASVSGSEMKLWNVASRREVAARSRGQPSLRFCAFSGDGQALVTVDWSGIVRLLRAPTLAEIDRKP